MARPPSDKPLSRLDYPLTPRVAKRLFDLQESMRKKGHGRQSPRTIVSALIMAEARRGDELYQDLLVPFRLNNPDVD
jgi:hypothetical protein